MSLRTLMVLGSRTGLIPARLPFGYAIVGAVAEVIEHALATAK